MKTYSFTDFWKYLFILPFLYATLSIPVACVDKDFDQPPAGGQDPNLPVNTTIAELKSRHVLGQHEEITDDVILAALVVSDDEEGNFFKQLVIADASGGIEIRIEMTDLHNAYPVGRKVYIKAKGLWLGDYNGLIQLGAGVGTDDSGDPELIRIPESVVDQFIISATYGNAVTPKIVSLDQLSLSDVSTLIRLEGVQFVAPDAGETYADPVLELTLNREVEDCARRRLIVRTSGFASFAGETTPTGSGSLVGILSVFRDDFQLTIRDLNDVAMSGDRCSIVIDESFNSLNDNDDILLQDWANIAVKGTRLWRAKVFQTNHYAQATAFGDQAQEMESWLITPDIVLNVPKKITFESAKAFYVHDGLTVWISSNFTGSNVSGATWTQLFPSLAGASSADNAFIPSGDIDLSGFTGPVRIGFRYIGSGPGGQTTSYRIDNVKVSNL